MCLYLLTEFNYNSENLYDIMSDQPALWPDLISTIAYYCTAKAYAYYLDLYLD